VTFASPLSRTERHRHLCYFGAVVDGFCLAMRSMEYLSQHVSKFNSLAELPRADVQYDACGTSGQMHIKRYKGDTKHT
jgi:hypothetical protein